MMHKSVLINDIVEILNPQNEHIYVDATFGGGGYAKAIKEKAPRCKIIAFDRDPFIAASENVKKYADEFHNAPFSSIPQYVTTKVDGVIFDFGVSSFQIDDPARGFSFQKEGPLDMRMSQTGLTAQDVVNNFSKQELADIVYYYGEETRSFKIADAIIAGRPFETTLQLAKVIETIVPRTKIHPATKTFQALRIFVNNELEEIKLGVQGALTVLNDTGRLFTVSFHALEDRALKEGVTGFKQTSKIFPAYQEIKENKRARSAKLRVFERRS